KYNMLHVGDKPVGGMMKFDKPGVPPHWVSYVSVSDVDATAKTAKASGGTLAVDPQDVPGFGRFAIILDPQNGVSAAWKSNQGDPARETPKVGEFCWEQLNATELAKVRPFYEKVYGWKVEPFGDGMSVFKAGEHQVASMMQAPPGVPTHWLTYVVVAKLERAREIAKRLGGKILMEEIAVPKIGKFAVVQDPTGATI